MTRLVSSAQPTGAPSETWRTLAERDGIHRLAVPTPFLVGRVNCYLIEDEPLTLVDTGPNSGKSLDELAQALERLGHSIEELELIVLTHQHMDHLGLLEILSRRSGAEVAAFHLLGPYLENFSASMSADDEFAMAIMLRHGVPPELATVLGSVGAAFRAFGSSGQRHPAPARRRRAGVRDRTLRVLHRPGHSPSDTVFWDEQRRLLIGGDHLIAHISSNPLLSRPLEPGAASPRAGSRRSPPCAAHLHRLDAGHPRARSRDVLPGHGEPVIDHVALIDERFRMHERRAGKMLSMLEAGPQRPTSWPPRCGATSRSRRRT